MLSENLYPEVPKASKFGGQEFADPDYVPVELDNKEAAIARMLAALDAKLGDEAVKAAGLDGSDEVGTVEKLFSELASEAAELRAIPFEDDIEDYEDQVFAKAKELNPLRWLLGAAAVRAATQSVDLSEELAGVESEEMVEDIEPEGFSFELP